MNYNGIYLNIPLRIYYQDSGNQITKTSAQNEGALKVKNYYTLWWLNTIYPIIRVYSKYNTLVARELILIGKISLLLKKPFLLVFREMNSIRHKLIVTLLYLPSFILFKFFSYI